MGQRKNKLTKKERKALRKINENIFPDCFFDDFSEPLIIGDNNPDSGVHIVVYMKIFLLTLLCNLKIWIVIYLIICLLLLVKNVVMICILLISKVTLVKFINTNLKVNYFYINFMSTISNGSFCRAFF